MTTIKQVATTAGVSFKTVSRVVNDDPNVSPSTRAKVLDAIEQLGYRPNLIARNMRMRRSHVLGLITEELATTPFAVNLIKGAQEAAWEAGFMLMVINNENNRERTNDAIQTLLERKVEGILYATMRHRVIDTPQHPTDTPLVLANCRDQNAHLTSVVPDDERGGYEATRALLESGRRKIAFINLEPAAIAAQERLQGYQRALAEANLPFREEWVQFTADGMPESGFRLASVLLEGTERPDALFCGNDRIAMGAYDAIRERGLRIPEDIAVIGFDNHDVIAAHLRPALSTMALPHYEMGHWAAEQLLRMIDQRAAQSEQLRLPCPYIARASI